MNDVLKIEPLKEILEMYSDKNQVFLDYMNIKVLKTIEGSVFYEENIDQLFIYDKLYCIDKSTHNVSHEGRIIDYSKDDITIKKNNKYYIRVNPKEYYIFYKRKLKKNSKKEFMISLLKIL